MDMNQFRKHLAKAQKLTEAPTYDGQVNKVEWVSQTKGSAIVMVHQKHDKGETGLDQAVFNILKNKLGPKLRALTRFKVEDRPVVTNTGNYHMVHVDFVTK